MVASLFCRPSHNIPLDYSIIKIMVELEMETSVALPVGCVFWIRVKDIGLDLDDGDDDAILLLHYREP